MKARSLILLVASVFAIAPISATSQTVEQSTTTAKGQAAINIVANALKVSANNLRVVSEVKLDSITRTKVLHTKTGRISGIDLDQNNRQVPMEQVRKILASKQRQDFKGKLEADLADRVSRSQPAATTSVVVWLKTSGTPPKINRSAAQSSEASAETAAFRNFHKNATQSAKQFIQARGGQVKYQSENAPLLVATVPTRLLSALEQRNDVQSIHLERTYKNELNVSIPAIDAPTVWNRGYTGSGVKVAVVEGGAIYFGHSNLADGSYCNSTNPSVSDHTTGVAGIIASTNSTYKGVAYGTPALLSGNVTNVFDDAAVIKCIDWAINNGARVINMSFGIDSTSSLVGLDHYVDYVVRNRAVTMVKSSGNKGYTCSAPGYNVTSPGKGWNIITVGNYDDKGTSGNGDDTMNDDNVGGSCDGDPSSPNGDREKPEVAAPGTDITTTYCAGPSNCTGTGTGTSFAAPHVAGCSALLMQRNTSLQYWPESIKAVLMASAVSNMEGSTRLSEKDGAGGIECDSADDVVSGASGVESHGTFFKSDFPKTFTFNANAGQTVRVAIGWNSTTNPATSTTPPTTNVLKADLDLNVYAPNGSYVTSSASYDNSYEIVEFTATSTGTYTAKVNAHRFDGDYEHLGFAAWKGTREKN
jgi:hypothetical protein